MKLPRDLSGKEVARLMVRHYGYRVPRTKGSHMTVTLTVGSNRTSSAGPRCFDEQGCLYPPPSIISRTVHP